MPENGQTPPKTRKTTPRTTTGKVTTPSIKHRDPDPEKPVVAAPEPDPPSDTPFYEGVKKGMGWEPGDDEDVWKEAGTVTKDLSDFKEAVDRDGFEARP